MSQSFRFSAPSLFTKDYRVITKRLRLSSPPASTHMPRRARHRDATPLSFPPFPTRRAGVPPRAQTVHTRAPRATKIRHDAAITRHISTYRRWHVRRVFHQSCRRCGV
jgi:hypothetical protein